MRKPQQLEPKTCGLCRILFVGYKILFRNCPVKDYTTLVASLAYITAPYVPGMPLQLEGLMPEYHSQTQTCAIIFISCNVHNAILESFKTMNY